MIYLSEEDTQFVISAVKAQTQKIIEEIELNALQNHFAKANEFLANFGNDVDIKIFSSEDNKPKASAINPKAPYGLKKDGTPAKRRGRPSAKAKKVNA